MEDLFQLLGKTYLLPSTYGNPHVMMMRDVTACLDADVAEYALTREVLHRSGVDKYTH